MSLVELSAGPIEYTDSGGSGPVLVLLHGLVMDGSVYDAVVAELSRDHRCIVPTLPLGSHRRPMRPDADLSLRGLGRMVGELLERLDLREVTLVQNDHAAALPLAGERPPRVARLVICSCEAFDNYPPGLPGKNVALLARIPGGIYLAFQLMRLHWFRRLPMTLGWMAKRRIPEAMVDAWLRPAQTQPEVRRDLLKYLRSGTTGLMEQVMQELRAFDRPALVIWASEDRVMPPEHGRRLAELLPAARLEEIDDSYTLVPLDQPQRFAQAVRCFVAQRAQAEPERASPRS